MVKIRVFIFFCHAHCNSQCESQKLNPHGNINYLSHLNHKCHDTNHVDVCWNTYKTLNSSKVWYFNISSSFVTHIVGHNMRDQSRWIPLISLWSKLSRLISNLFFWLTVVKSCDLNVDVSDIWFHDYHQYDS